MRDTVTFMDIQQGFMELWKGAGLESLAPAVFDKPADTTNPPFARLKLKRTERLQHSEGEIWVMMVMGEVRLNQGSAQRQEIETKIQSLNEKIPVIKGKPAMYFGEADERTLEDEDKQFGGKAVERIPIAWTLQLELKYHV